MEPAVTQRNTAEIRIGAWYAEELRTLRFPEGWEVHRLDPDDAPPIADDAVREAFANPIGAPRLRDAARGKRSAVVAVDDLTRPTPVHRVLPALLEELRAGGLEPSQVVILLGTAAHRPMLPDEIERKLGPGVASRHPIVQHDFVGPDLRHLGWIEGGPVQLNRHFLDAELRICVGGVIPHNETGFGGGSKMVVPGVAGRETIAHFHGALPPRLAGVLQAEPGRIDRRVWSEAIARHVGVDAVVCCTINARRELAGLYVGDLVEAHRAAGRQAGQIGRTRVPRALAERCDVAVVSAYPLDTDPIQMGKSINLAKKLGARSTVVINAATDGIFYHGMGMGSGVHPPRLLRNLPRLLTSPHELWAWLRGLSRAAAVGSPLLAARLSYFSLNDLSYGGFCASEGAWSADRAVPQAGEDAADPLVWSEAFPTWGFRRKYRNGRLYRDWDALAEVLGRRFEPSCALVFPCAPLQLLEIDPS